MAQQPVQEQLQQAQDTTLLQFIKNKDAIASVTLSTRYLSRDVLVKLFQKPGWKPKKEWEKKGDYVIFHLRRDFQDQTNCMRFALTISQNKYVPPFHEAEKYGILRDQTGPDTDAWYGKSFAEAKADLIEWWKQQGFKTANAKAGTVAAYLEESEDPLTQKKGAGDPHAVVKTADGSWWSKWGTEEDWVSKLKPGLVENKADLGTYKFVGFFKPATKPATQLFSCSGYHEGSKRVSGSDEEEAEDGVKGGGGDFEGDRDVPSALVAVRREPTGDVRDHTVYRDHVRLVAENKRLCLQMSLSARLLRALREDRRALAKSHHDEAGLAEENAELRRTVADMHRALTAAHRFLA